MAAPVGNPLGRDIFDECVEFEDAIIKKHAEKLVKVDKRNDGHRERRRVRVGEWVAKRSEDQTLMVRVLLRDMDQMEAREREFRRDRVNFHIQLTPEDFEEEEDLARAGGQNGAHIIEEMREYQNLLLTRYQSKTVMVVNRADDGDRHIYRSVRQLAGESQEMRAAVCNAIIGAEGKPRFDDDYGNASSSWHTSILCKNNILSDADGDELAAAGGRPYGSGASEQVNAVYRGLVGQHAPYGQTGGGHASQRTDVPAGVRTNANIVSPPMAPAGSTAALPTHYGDPYVTPSGPTANATRSSTVQPTTQNTALRRPFTTGRSVANTQAPAQRTSQLLPRPATQPSNQPSQASNKGFCFLPGCNLRTLRPHPRATDVISHLEKHGLQGIQRGHGGNENKKRIARNQIIRPWLRNAFGWDPDHPLSEWFHRHPDDPPYP